jgi:TRAP-type mannitol/chloroaromatic compound transport system substrate-binding protein
MSVTPEHYEFRESWKIIAEIVDTMSDGRLQIDYFPAGALAPTSELFGSVGEGTIDIASIPTIYMAGIAPVTNIIWAPPFTLMKLSEWSWALNHLGLNELLAQGLEPHGVKYITAYMYGDYGALMSSKPIRTIADFKGKKIRTWGIYAKYFDAMGAGIVSMPGEEIYTGISLGTIDAAAWSNPQGFWALNMHEVAKYYILPPACPTNLGAIIVSNKVWNRMPADLQEIMSTAMKWAALEAGPAIEAEGVYALARMVQDHGVEKITLSGDDVAYITNLAKGFIEEEAAKDTLSTQAYDVILEYMKALGYTD